MKIFLDGIKFLHNLMQQLLFIENTYRLYFLDLFLLFFIQSEKSIYKSPRLKMLYDICNRIVEEIMLIVIVNLTFHGSEF